MTVDDEDRLRLEAVVRAFASRSSTGEVSYCAPATKPGKKAKVTYPTVAAAAAAALAMREIRGDPQYLYVCMEVPRRRHVHLTRKRLFESEWMSLSALMWEQISTDPDGFTERSKLMILARYLGFDVTRRVNGRSRGTKAGVFINRKLAQWERAGRIVRTGENSSLIVCLDRDPHALEVGSGL